MILMYYRTYLIQDGMTHLFGISQVSISTDIGKIVPTIWECLPVPRDVCEQAKKRPAMEELNRVFSGPVALTDTSEQSIQQSKRSDMEESHYAKAKTHTVKVQYTISFDGLTVHKTTHSPGRRHDFKICRMRRPTFPDGLWCGNEANPGRFRHDHLRHYTDRTYIAMGKAIPRLDYATPLKRRQDKDLALEQWAHSRVHSRVRIRVENGIRSEILPIIKVREQAGVVRPYRNIVCMAVNQAILMKRDGILRGVVAGRRGRSRTVFNYRSDLRKACSRRHAYWNQCCPTERSYLPNDPQHTPPPRSRERNLAIPNK